MTNHHFEELEKLYRSNLLTDTLPFWIEHSVDRECGGFQFSVDRGGRVFDTDKGIWQHGRFTWLLSTLYERVEARSEWLGLAAHGIEFLRQHAFDSDGRVFFQVTRDGRPLRKRRYLFSESFAIVALSSYARVSGDERARDEAVALGHLVEKHLRNPSLLGAPKVDATTRPMKGLALPMILLNTGAELQSISDDPLFEEWIERSAIEIERDFMKPDLEAVLENVGPDGSRLPGPTGRLMNPGHAIEAAWFLLSEHRRRGGDATLKKAGLEILDWMWERGWDREFGGLYYFRDLEGLPVQEYWHDMKFWWPHNEAIIACLMAFAETGEERHLERHRLCHDWAHEHFADPDGAEWFGYLHRDGTVSSTEKGNLWKGPFHLPRMQLLAMELCGELAAAEARGV